VRFYFLLAVLSGTSAKLHVQSNPAYFAPLPPFRIAGNLYYVGSKDLASYLVVTPKGDVLVNSSYPRSVPLIKASVEKLGYKFSNIKILLISHAHSDHCGGSALVKKLTGARYMVMDSDAPEVEAGGRGNFQFDKNLSMRYNPAKVDRVLHDGDEIRLGGSTIVARKTPGHTKGCTTYTMKVEEGGKTLNAVIVGSPYVLSEYLLVNNPTYPQIAKDYTKTFRVLKSLPCDLFLGAHGSYFGLLEKFPNLKPGKPNPFIDPSGYASFVKDSEDSFQKNLAKQEAKS
jgi:metallo-beta-lactamase class B